MSKESFWKFWRRDLYAGKFLGRSKMLLCTKPQILRRPEGLLRRTIRKADLGREPEGSLYTDPIEPSCWAKANRAARLHERGGHLFHAASPASTRTGCRS